MRSNSTLSQQRPWRTLAALLVVLSLLAAACSQDDGDSTSDDTTPETAEETSTDGDTATETEAADTDEADADPADATEDEAAAPEAAPEIAEYIAATDSCTTSAGITEDTINIGLMAGLSGAFGAYAESILAGLEAYIDEINAGGGVAGREIVLTRADHEYDPALAATRYEELAADSAVVLSHGTQPTNQILPQTQEDCMPTLVLGQGGINALDPNSFIYSTPNAYMTLNAMEWAVTEQDATGTWGIIHQQDVAGQEILEATRFGAEHLGVDLAVEASFELGDTDFAAQVRQLVDGGVEWVLLAAFPPACIQIMSEAVSQGADLRWTGPAVCWGGEQTFAQTEATQLAEQVGLTQASYTSGWAASDDPVLVEATEVISRNAGVEGQVPLLGYSAGNLVVELLTTAFDAYGEDLTRGDLVSSIAAIGDVPFQNLFCGVSFGEEGQPHNPSREAMILSISADQEPDGYVLERECFAGDAAQAFELASLVE